MTHCPQCGRKTVRLRYSVADRADIFYCTWRLNRANACGWSKWAE